MGALGLLAITGGIVLIRSAITGESPIEVVVNFLDMAQVQRFQGWGGGGGFSAGTGGGSSWGPTPNDPVKPENVI